MTALGDVNALYFTKPPQLDEAIARTAVARRAEHAFWADIGAKPSGSHVSSAFSYLVSERRDSVFHIIVVDHMMPGERGRDYCARHAKDGLYRILLTGVADSTTAVDAFNQRDIDYFLPKQSRGLRNKLVSVLLEAQDRLNNSATTALRARTDPAVLAELHKPRVAAGLSGILRDYGVSEYIFLDQPLGLAAITRDKRKLWFQLETPQTLQDLAELLAESQAETHLIEPVLQHLQTVNIELARRIPVQSPLSSANLTTLGDNNALFVGVFGLES